MKRNITKVVIFSIIVTINFVFGSTSVFAETDSPALTKYIPGDINNDFEVNIEDATIIQKSLAGLQNLSYKQQFAADFNGDNEVEITDVTEIQKKIADLDYLCIVNPDNSYQSIKVEKVNDSSFENAVEIEKVIDGFDYFQGRTLNRNGIYLIKSVDEYYDFFGYCQPAFDEIYFEENSLIVWTKYVPENSDFAYDFREITMASVSDGALKLRCTRYSPFLDAFVEPNNRNYTLIYRVKKSDIEEVNGVINVYNELIYRT
ncbi:dockerin type I repeat-containing protein [Ruminococcus sp.]|uniref:dockerin type I repeat-containing protein n=1 Tax=Ruminococcus sp. TaxID=41978 RepID=UPI00260AC5DE|nr:dockerin type I repeat-containing protein [Ruminococcus sp.]MDD6988499.1 dockerin type I repeat-containing protein [Ruminococcus sp.]MDY6200812.1 dockerin type I repeat-containing protein [Ruminococcus sp.]